MSKVLEADNVT